MPVFAWQQRWAPSSPVPLQEKMAANLKAGKSEVLETGHLCMLSRPQQVAEAINRFTA